MRIAHYKRMFNCDEARVVCFPGKLFLVVGWKRRSQGEWFECGPEGMRPYDFTYIEEEAVATGRNERELAASARKYKKLERSAARCEQGGRKA